MHFAAWLAVGESVRDPLGYYQNNVVGSLALLGAMVDAGVKRLVFSSTCAVYGEPATVPIVETLDTQPINAYGETKLAIERALPHVERAHGLRWIALRYFNAAGAHPDGTIGEDHDRRDPPDSARDPAPRPAARRCRCSARTIRRRTAPACATTFTCATSPTRTCGRSRRSSAAAPSGAYNAGTGHAALGASR